MTHFPRRLAAVLVLLVSVVMGAAPTLAAAETATIHFDVSQIFDEGNPCVPVTGVASVHAVYHETVVGDAAHWTTTETGDLVGAGPDGEVLAHYTFRFGGSFRSNVFDGVFALSAHGTAGGEPFVLNLLEKFREDSNTGIISGTTTYNCHDGSGPQSETYSSGV
jgi:hypothetical protein